MTTWLIRCFAGLLLILPFVPAVADDPDDKEIARLLKQLGSSDFRMRDAATKRLEEIGEPALDALIRAMKCNGRQACCPAPTRTLRRWLTKLIFSAEKPMWRHKS